MNQNTITQEGLLNEAKRLINEYLRTEFHINEPEEEIFADLRKIAIGYTTVTDDEIPAQIYVNLIDNSIERYLEHYLIDNRKYSSLYLLIENELKDLSFDWLMSFEESDIELYHSMSGQKCSEHTQVIER